MFFSFLDICQFCFLVLSHYHIIESPNTGIHELHTFTDASLSTVSAVVYLKTISADGSIATHYVISKSKVAPIKQLSIPKLELEAATLGAELAEL